MSSVTSVLRNPSRIFYGWKMLALISFMGALNSSFYSKGAALFLIPVENSLGLSRATTSLIFSLARSEGAVEGPLIGYLVDWYGPKKMLVIGTIIAGVGFLIFSQAHNVWIFAIAYLGFISLGATMGFQHAVAASVNLWFSRFRVRALSIQEASGNLGSMILIPLLGLIIAVYDWRVAAIFGALAYFVVVLPLSPLVKRSPESIGLLPDGADPQEVEAARQSRATGGATDTRQMLRYYDNPEYHLKEALRSPTYWLLLIGTMLRQMAKAPIQVHIVAILQWKGLDVAAASLVFAFWLGMNVPSKLFFGFIGDRMPKQLSLGGGMLLYALAMALLLYGNSVWVFLGAAVVGGMAEGITPINWGAIGDYFGRRYFATLRGIMNLSHSWALVLLPWLAGWWFDRAGSYTLTLWASLIAALLAAVFYVLMRRPRTPARLVVRQPVAEGVVRE
ncbi:MAG: MFS transporter [Dehalococcoidia bacterium]